jgi:hypothetical protein
MSIAQFTPGPWFEDATVVSAGDQDICYMGEPAQWSGDCFHALANYKANARLIAAAPDLYQALSVSRKVLESAQAAVKVAGLRDTIALADAVLAKVEGKSA